MRLREQGGGVILNVSWDHVLTGAPGREAEIYAAAKGGVLAFSKCLARSFAPEVRVNVLAPGWIATGYAAGLTEGERRRIAEATPLGRWGTPQDVAGAAVFLASAEAEFLTGATMLVGGGTVM
jgi:3-oxoacyl-[acyl-carrier protein] reductase